MTGVSAREDAFVRNGPYWHLHTSGERMEIIFPDEGAFRFGITLLGICLAAFPACRVLTFALMSNHIHLLLAGPEADVRALFALFRKRLARYLSGQGVFAPLRRFEASLFRVPDLQTLRNEIIYIKRNGYVVHPECTPYSYPWSAAPAFFNPWMSLLPTTPFSALTVQERRTLCRCREAVLPEHYRVFRGALFPASFCAIGEAESCFRDAHQYFRRLSRDHEAHSEVAGK